MSSSSSFSGMAVGMALSRQRTQLERGGRPKERCCGAAGMVFMPPSHRLLSPGQHVAARVADALGGSPTRGSQRKRQQGPQQHTADAPSGQVLWMVYR